MHKDLKIDRGTLGGLGDSSKFQLLDMKNGAAQPMVLQTVCFCRNAVALAV